MKRKGLGGILAASMLVAALTTAAPAVAGGCATKSTNLESFEVGIDNSKRTYRKGQVARFEVSVIRPVEVGGERVAEEPVEGAHVYLSVRIGESVLVAGGTTDSHGVAKLRLRLKRWISPGWADAFVLASKDYVDGPCLRVSEHGKVAADRLFRVRG